MPATERPTHRTITPDDLDRARAILDVEAKTQALIKKVPSAGMGVLALPVEGLPERWAVVISRGEAGCGDHRHFTVDITGPMIDPAVAGHSGKQHASNHPVHPRPLRPLPRERPRLRRRR